MADVFISYAHTTARQAQAAAAALRGTGYSVWLDDDLAVHREFTQAIEEQLTAAKAVLVIWSADAAKSAWVLSEANRAREDRKLVQLVIDKSRMPMPFDQVQCADLVGWTGEGEHPNWRRVIASIGELVGGNAPSPARTAQSRAAPPARAEALLAVLAFDNLSGDPEMDYFSEGVSEEIRESVARGTDLKVIGRASSFHFRGADKAAANVSVQLGATHVLDGSVRRNGPRVRVLADLVRCADATSLWSERFDRELTDTFTLQDEIAAAVAGALQVVFAPEAKSRLADTTVYELFLKSRELVAGNVADREVWATAIDMLERATRLAPNFARGWSSLAYVRAMQLRYHERDEPYAALRAKVTKAAETALRLDPKSGEARVALANLEPFGNYAAFEAEVEQALAASPNDAMVTEAMAWFLYGVGRTGEAVAMGQQGFKLDPMNVMVASGYAICLAAAGRYAESKEVFERNLGAWPRAPLLFSNAIGFAAAAQDWERVEVVTMLARENGVGDAVQQMVDLVRALRTKDARYAAGYLRFARSELERTGNVSELEIANLCAFGLADEAFDLVERASFDYVSDAEEPSRSGFTFGAILTPGIGDDLIRDPRFPRLCARLGLCHYWVTTDRWPDLADAGVTPYDFRAECRRHRAGA
ncbi:MAG TPA: TIR domain-containing protein [Caulobacteraceae bacterium]|nr:TIR domain-containing protein [Caulobacteraceae bacterium]